VEVEISFTTFRDIKLFRLFLVITLVAGITCYSAKTNAQTKNSFRDCVECPEMIEIQKGSFFMGSDNVREEEKPVHQITIENDFAVGKYEITRKQYELFIKSFNYTPELGCETWDLPSFNMDLTKSWTDPDFEQDADHPVVCVNWHDTQAYVKWLSELTGMKYRLLSEAEWEYVARSGSTTRYSFGDSIDSTKANYGDEFRGTTPTGSYPENQFGLHDMHGNASEWVADCWIDNYKNAQTTAVPRTVESCKRRVFRGGTWHNKGQYLRSAYRYAYIAGFRLSGLGFRVARQL
jgi:formylglycine-generating enzyme required for sulfatase activity